jgi:hypothetical protein
MLGIYIAAFLTTCLALILIGVPLFRQVDASERRLLGLLMFLMLPLSAVAFFIIRVPLDTFVMSAMPSGYHTLLVPWYEALSEEPIKLAPLLLAWLYASMAQVNPARLGLAMGLGFGIGAAWTTAGLLAQVPSITQYPWYTFTGFIGERLLFCILHAAFTATALYFIFQRKQVMAGIGIAIALHFLLNLPTFLAAARAFGLNAGVWNFLLQLWNLLWLVLAGLLLARVAYGNAWRSRIGDLWRGKNQR